MNSIAITRTPTVQELIKVKLAQWLGLTVLEIRPPAYSNIETQVIVCKPTATITRFVFNPYHDSEMGLAQVMQCILKAVATEGFKVVLWPGRVEVTTNYGDYYDVLTVADETGERHIDAVLEAIYKSIGGEVNT